jgi:MFS transporter, CP family, cyanate transporter
VAVGLRAPIIAAAPLLHEIQASLGLTSAQAGLLTTLPVLCFGAFSPLAPLLARRYSMELLIFAATLVLIVAIGLRLVPFTPLLYGGMLLAGIASRMRPRAFRCANCCTIRLRGT